MYYYFKKNNIFLRKKSFRLPTAIITKQHAAFVWARTDGGCPVYGVCSASEPAPYSHRQHLDIHVCQMPGRGYRHCGQTQVSTCFMATTQIYLFYIKYECALIDNMYVFMCFREEIAKQRKIKKEDAYTARVKALFLQKNTALWVGTGGGHILLIDLSTRRPIRIISSFCDSIRCMVPSQLGTCILRRNAAFYWPYFIIYGIWYLF